MLVWIVTRSQTEVSPDVSTDGRRWFHGAIGTNRLMATAGNPHNISRHLRTAGVGFSTGDRYFSLPTKHRDRHNIRVGNGIMAQIKMHLKQITMEIMNTNTELNKINFEINIKNKFQTRDLLYLPPQWNITD